ncbi:unnamed protein product [Eruca vesicaria subsp. sativa]|uniref:Protein kinase domain-containing protein n=1 Tax=Eruca vesicaria subsp. sativa TaxID=29727 RepID=A0ABC8JSB1_ERUVS|nr:unnamed protein product [Eruca vesicaria subsp. sativa]
MEFWRRKKEKKNARKCFLENGSVFLKELIADCNGISNPIRMFSSDQISNATNNFDPNCSLPLNSSWSIWYKGVIEGRSYLIKRFTSRVVKDEENAYNDIVLSARVSNHIGFLKLIGYCLEFPHQLLLFEDLEYRPLNHLGSLGHEVEPVLSWNVRLKIAKEVVVAITYLHTAFPRIIIHRDIKPTNVFLDKNGTAKLSDFSLAIALPEGKTWKLERVFGTFVYIDPIYQLTSIVTEYVDVYVFSFGIFMLVLLLGRQSLMAGSDGYMDTDTSILDHVKGLRERGEHVEFGGDLNDMRPVEMKMLLDLALECCEERKGDRPKMIVVAKQIKLIERYSIVLSARVSKYIGFPKLTACCLEDLEYRVLNIRGSLGSEDAPVLPWNARLKIAKEVATSITYLHTAYPRIIIHRDIKATNVSLDKNGRAKLNNFSLAIALPEGKTWIEDSVTGTPGYLDPLYYLTEIVSEYTDVYSFGIFMLVLLLGRQPLLAGSDGYVEIGSHILDYVKHLRERGEHVEFGGDSTDMRPIEMKMLLDLALECCEVRKEDKPKMLVVEKEIKLIERYSIVKNL